MEYIFLFAALLIGLAAGFFMAHFRSRSAASRLEERNESLTDRLQEAETELEDLRVSSEQRLEKLRKDHQQEIQDEREKNTRLEKELAAMQADHRNLKERLDEQKNEIKEMQEQLKIQFQNLANKILEENSEKFSKQNKESLNQLLKPLGDNLASFKQKVEETYDAENRQRATLKEQIRQMSDLNEKMREDARNLTRALKGDSKAQGNWGEMILERILERSGLTKGREYEVQDSKTTEDGRRLQPDVVVNLPEDKFLIIDSKVSLTAYERFSSAEEDKEQEKAIKEHVNSLYAHVKGLSAKNYQQLHGDKSPDFVLMFVPIEPAFALALQADQQLYYEAFDRNIVIVSPSTLLATLATIDSIWKQEYRNENARAIAERGGALYDKFVGFLESMDDIGKRIEQTQRSYDDAVGRLKTGRGNVVRQVEMLREMKVDSTKKLPDRFNDYEEE